MTGLMIGKSCQPPIAITGQLTGQKKRKKMYLHLLPDQEEIEDANLNPSPRKKKNSLMGQLAEVAKDTETATVAAALAVKNSMKCTAHSIAYAIKSATSRIVKSIKTHASALSRGPPKTTVTSLLIYRMMSLRF